MRNDDIWRRREGVEPSGNLTAPRLVLKTSGTTGHLPSPARIHLVSMSARPGKASDVERVLRSNETELFQEPESFDLTEHRNRCSVT
jgi:hypothetical protein